MSAAHSFHIFCPHGVYKLRSFAQFLHFKIPSYLPLIYRAGRMHRPNLTSNISHSAGPAVASAAGEFHVPEFSLPCLMKHHRTEEYGLRALLGRTRIPFKLTREMAAFKEWSSSLVQLDRCVMSLMTVRVPLIPSLYNNNRPAYQSGE